MEPTRDQTDSKAGAEDRTAIRAGRRRALIRLGLAVGAAYVAPTVLSIDRSARAMGPSCAKNPKNC
jgi:hypothetical protein